MMTRCEFFKHARGKTSEKMNHKVAPSAKLWFIFHSAFVHVIRIIEARETRNEIEEDRARGTVTLLGDDDFRLGLI